MNKIAILSILSLILVTACGTDKGHFKLDGRLLNLNQGEFLIYSPDGAMPGIDTIHVEGGRFELLAECVHEGTAIIIMPNGLEMAVFVRPGASLSLRGDAQNLRMAEIVGTDDNEVMNEFRKAVNGKPDKDLQPFVKDAITKHPESCIGTYLIRRYMLTAPKPDYATILQLLGIMQKEQKDNAAISIMHKQVTEQQKTSVGTKVPSFSVKDINEKAITQRDISHGLAIVLFWASWDYDSQQQVRAVSEMIKEKADAENSATVMAVSLDGSAEVAERSLSNYKDKIYLICDGKMTEGTLPRTFAATQTGTAIVLKDGKILERTLTGENLYAKLRKLLPSASQ